MVKHTSYKKMSGFSKQQGGGPVAQVNEPEAASTLGHGFFVC